MNKTISVIVPVYNVEKYIRECLESIINQTYKDLEIILIDDGSTDSSGLICDEYSIKDSRIKVIHQKNGGAASAKNSGLRNATGNYLAFVDSDDYLELDAYEYMQGILEKNQAECVQCLFSNVYKEETFLPKENHLKMQFNNIDYLRKYTTDWTCGLLWDKLYVRSIFDNIYFEEGHKIDDEYFTYQGIMNSNKIIVCNRIVYNYRQRKSSIMFSEKSQEKIILDKIDYLDKRRKRVGDCYPILKKDLDYHYLDMLLLLSKNKFLNIESANQIKTKINEYYKEKKQIKLPLRFRLQLIKLQYTKIENILKKKETNINDINIDSYFE